MNRGAVIDPGGQYRYRLWREWQPDGPRLGFIMLNPSTADALQDDPTIRRCIGFARSWGYGGLEILNLFAYRTPHPQVLRQVSDPVGQDNDRYLLEFSQSLPGWILAWGNRGSWQHRNYQVLDLLNDTAPLYCLGLTQLGHPRHPLYTKSNTRPMQFPDMTLP